MVDDETNVQDVPEEDQPDDQEEPTSEAESRAEFTQDDVDRIVKERLEREKKKAEKDKEKAERQAREKALQDQEDWKKLAEERTNTISEREKRIEELEAIEGERDTAHERISTLEKRLTGLIKPQLEVVPELYRPFLNSMPVEEQAQWLEKNAEKLGTQHGNGRPAGSRPTGRAAPPQRQESEKEAREAQQAAGISRI